MSASAEDQNSQPAEAIQTRTPSEIARSLQPRFCADAVDQARWRAVLACADAYDQLVALPDASDVRMKDEDQGGDDAHGGRNDLEPAARPELPHDGAGGIAPLIALIKKAFLVGFYFPRAWVSDPERVFTGNTAWACYRSLNLESDFCRELAVASSSLPDGDASKER